MLISHTNNPDQGVRKFLSSIVIIKYLKHHFVCSTLAHLGLCLYFFGQARPVSAQIAQLYFIGEHIITETHFASLPLGGLSGIERVADTDKYYLLSDARPALGGARMYEVQLSYDARGVQQVRLERVVRLCDSLQHNAKGYCGNAESLRYCDATKQWFWASEGDENAKPPIQPFIAIMGKDTPLALPPGYRYDTTQTRGLLPNKAIESIAFVPRTTLLWVCAEAPRYEDQAPYQYFTRLTLMDIQRNKVKREYAYPLDSLPDNGVVDMLALSPAKLWVLERAYNRQTRRNSIRLYEADCAKAEDIKKIRALREYKPAPVRKRLLMDFDTLVQANQIKKIDNVEGMTWGKPLADGTRTLILVSDDNFNRAKGQITQIIVMGLK